MPHRFDTAILDHLPDAVVVLDPGGIVLHWNTAAETIFGYTAAEAQGHPLAELIVGPDQRDGFGRVLSEAEATGLCIGESVRHHKGGSRLHVSGSAKAVRNAGGDLECFVITQKDVTALKAVRDTRLVEAKYRDLLEHTPDALLIVNVTGHVVMANAQTQSMFGFTRQQLIGQPVEILLPERYQEAHLAHRGRFFDSPRTRAMGAALELFGRHRSGEEFPVEIGLSPLETEEGIMVMCAVRDITDRREARHKADRKFRDLLESAPDAMVIVNQSGAIVLVNYQTVELFGWKREELLGKPVEMLVPERLRAAHPEHRSAFLSQSKGRHQTGAGLVLTGLRKDRSEFPVEISLSSIHTEDGLLVASTIRDASERKQTEQILLETNRLKSEFLASMSHELRTPLNGILGFSELLADERVGKLNDKQKEYIDDINESGKHLLKLINDVLDLSKVEAGKMEIYTEEFSPRVAIAAVFSLLRPAATKKQIQLNMPTGNAITSVTLDLQKFKQILFNLLSNAVKFTDRGGQVHVALEAEAADLMRLTVRDTGIGIAPADMAQLFQAFKQLEGGPSRHYEGTGLGLTLTRKLVELHGGRIEVESMRGAGSSFIVRLPLWVRSSASAA